MARFSIPLGDLKPGFTIEKPAKTGDGEGGTVASWSTLANTFASLRSVPRDEQLGQGTVSAVRTSTVVLRYIAGVTTKCRLTYRGRVLEIASVENVDDDNAWLRLVCYEKEKKQPGEEAVA